MKTLSIYSRIRRLFFILLPAATLLTAVTGCVQTVGTPDLPYVEQLSVSCFIYADSTDVAVNVSHSLPLNEEFTFEKAAVPDADVTLQTPDSLLHIPYDVGRFQYRIGGVVAKVGSEYHLTVRWHGKTATGTTYIPPTPVVDSVASWLVNDGDFRQRLRLRNRATFEPNRNAAIATVVTLLAMNGSDTLAADTIVQDYRGLPNFRNVISGMPTDTGVVMNVNANGFFDRGIIIDSTMSLIVRFAALDIAYYDFYKTFRNTRDASLLGSFGTNPLFNIKGDAIGVFSGVSPVTRWSVVPIRQ